MNTLRGWVKELPDDSSWLKDASCLKNLHNNWRVAIVLKLTRGINCSEEEVQKALEYEAKLRQSPLYQILRGDPQC